MVVVAEGAGADAALTAGLSVSSSGLGVSAKGTGRSAGTVVNAAALTAASEVAAPVVKRAALGVVPAAAMRDPVVVPIETPIRPAPSKTTEESNAETDAEREVGALIPDSGIGIPSRPRHDGTSVNQPGIICGDVNHIGAGRLNDDSRAVRGYGLLRRGLQVAGLLRPLAHRLYGIHHVLFLVVVGVAQG